MNNKDINAFLNGDYNTKFDYTYYTNIAYIIKSIKPEQKIDSINYYLSNIGKGSNPKYERIFFNLLKSNFYSIDELASVNAFEKMFNICSPEYFIYIPSNIFNNRYFIEALLNCNVERNIYDYLPKVLRDNSIIQQKFVKKENLYNYSGVDKNGYDREWLDSDGNLIYFFDLANGIEVQNKDDYLKLVDEYLDSDITVLDFCDKYKISSVDGFNKLLERVGKENLDKNAEINDIKSNSQDLFKRSLFRYIDQLMNGSMSFDEYFKKYYKPVHNIGILINFASIKDCSRDFAKKIIDFYCEYDKPYTNNMINFLNKSSVTGINNPFNYFNELKSNLKTPEDNIYFKKISDICNRINKCRAEYFRDTMYITYKINDEIAVVDDGVIDQAIAYVKDNDIYVCAYNMKKIAEDIAFGRINYKIETESLKEKMKNNLNDLLNRVETIDEYINVVKMSGKER